MTKQEIKQKLARGEFRITSHAVTRMNERYITEADIKSCGRTAKRLTFQEDNDSWKVVGKDLDGYKITVICAVRGHMLIVTVY